MTSAAGSKVVPALPAASSRLSAVFGWLRFKPDHVAATIAGGLGNQLFQYAAARALALRLRMPLRVDHSDSADEYGRTFGLEEFGLGITRLSDRERALWLGPGAGRSTQRFPCRWADRWLLRRRLIEPNQQFDATLLLRRRPAFLNGLWQSETYFSEQAPELRREFLRHTPDFSGEPLFDQLRQPDSVALHVRRGDYLEPGVKALLGLCTPGYYRQAAVVVRAAVPSARFFLFSNDPEWVRSTPALASLGTVVPSNERSPSWNLRLMSQCRHFITANSSFSWWAAWLGEKPGSVVCCPAPWFTSAPGYQRHIVPDRWRSIAQNA